MNDTKPLPAQDVGTGALLGDCVFEVVDSTLEEQYWPLGIFPTEEDAMAIIRADQPPKFEGACEDAVRVEVRRRRFGFHPHEFETIAAREWYLNWDFADHAGSAPQWKAGPLRVDSPNPKISHATHE